MLAPRRWYFPCTTFSRPFSARTTLHSGHNRWSKIKHDKAKIDASIGKRNSAISSELIKLTRAFGPDPILNTPLAQLIASAKRQGYPKSAITSAIARGQGISPNGTALENVTIEAMLPSGVAAIIECQTDSKARSLQEIRTMITKAGGNMAPTTHLFEKRGRVVFGNSKGVTEDEALDPAIEAGATEVKIVEDDKIEIMTEPAGTSKAIKMMKEALGLEAERSEILWVANEETAVEVLESEPLEQLIEKIEDEQSVTDVYLNTR